MTDQTKNPYVMVLVPREPTEAMLDAGNEAAKAGGCDLYGLKRELLNGYAAMLDAAPQSPALGGEPEVAIYMCGPESRKRYLRKDAAFFDWFSVGAEPLIRLNDHRTHLAPLQAEIERHKANAEEWEKASLHWMAERDQLKARNAELLRLLDLAWRAEHISAADCKKIDAALSNPAEGEQV